MTPAPVPAPTVTFEPVKIEVVNEAPTVISNDEIQAITNALNVAGPRDFAIYWGTYAVLTFDPTKQQPDDSSWWLGFFDTSDQAGALGYHDLTPNGLPLAKIFAGTDKQYGANPAVTASHELWEALVDPYCDLAATVDNGNSLRLYAYETADAVEADNLAYDVNGTKVSDFVTPAWFISQSKASKFDFLGHVSQSFQLAPGGYISYLDAQSSQGWQQLNAREAGLDTGPHPHYSDRPRLGSRRERRRTPKSQWHPSTVQFGDNR